MGVVCTGERFGGMDLSNATAPMQTPQKPLCTEVAYQQGHCCCGDGPRELVWRTSGSKPTLGSTGSLRVLKVIQQMERPLYYYIWSDFSFKK